MVAPRPGGANPSGGRWLQPAMPIYEYSCQECDRAFEELVIRRSDEGQVKCPKCGSRRVGRKGKHTGSTGLYPVEVVRRINLIKRMMLEGMTIDDIRGSFVTLKNRLEDVEHGFAALLQDLGRKAREHPQRRVMESELDRAEREVRQALRRIEKVGGRIATVPPRTGLGGTG